MFFTDRTLVKNFWRKPSLQFGLLKYFNANWRGFISNQKKFFFTNSNSQELKNIFFFCHASFNFTPKISTNFKKRSAAKKKKKRNEKVRDHTQKKQKRFFFLFPSFIYSQSFKKKTFFSPHLKN